MNVTVYTTTTCPYCKQLMSYLDEKGIKYTTKIIDTDAAAQEEMSKLSDGFLGVPFVAIEKDGKVETVLGFDKAKINSILGI